MMILSWIFDNKDVYNINTNIYTIDINIYYY